MGLTLKLQAFCAAAIRKITAVTVKKLVILTAALMVVLVTVTDMEFAVKPLGNQNFHKGGFWKEM